ncbi:uncharacterized protein TRIADDRAFT_55344 [Trichoplax adhaerens]|uniref:TIR domain-containing protein n=1 Tax=Trichoplax adhaerens TaxID=10228 RepID=B3RUM4_TRIAD|nr:predicted protein [Trichoplax adhaerens]EDV25845.1 predicted protein [Trichoplax adhaerens]|eukprot:XP_002111878.1 predicted protein [Trichoplax adhaerens]
MANNDYYFCFDVNDSKIAYEVKKECEKLGLKIRIPNDSRRGASLIATMTTNFHACNRIVFFLTENLLMNITWVHLLADPHVRDLLLFNSDANTLIPIWYATPLLIRKYAPFFYGRIPIYGSDGSTDAASCLADIASS